PRGKGHINRYGIAVTDEMTARWRHGKGQPPGYPTHIAPNPRLSTQLRPRAEQVINVVLGEAHFSSRPRLGRGRRGRHYARGRWCGNGGVANLPQRFVGEPDREGVFRESFHALARRAGEDLGEVAVGLPNPIVEVLL